MSSAPILDNKNPDAPSVFEPAALLREARRQKGLPEVPVPSVCILDPDTRELFTGDTFGISYRESDTAAGPFIFPTTTPPQFDPEQLRASVARLAALEKLRTQFPGLHFAGNYLNGPAVGTCIEQAFKVADDIRISFAN